MEISSLNIFILISFVISFIINVLMFWFLRKSIKRWFVASELAASIFTHLDSFREHLFSVYELEQFYGEPVVKRLIEHSTDLIEFLKNFEDVYSLTQPDLEEILMEESDKMSDFEISSELDEKEEK